MRVSFVAFAAVIIILLYISKGDGVIVKKFDTNPNEIIKINNNTEIWKFFHKGTTVVGYDEVRVNSIRHGLAKFYREDGKIRAIVTYINGEKTGFAVTFYENGNPINISFVPNHSDIPDWGMNFSPDGQIQYAGPKGLAPTQ